MPGAEASGGAVVKRSCESERPSSFSGVHVADSCLLIEYLGKRLNATHGFTFGRRAELVLDPDNQYLHGKAGELRTGPGGWTIHNVGSTLHFRLLHQTGQMIELPPTTMATIPAGHGRVRIVAGPLTYEFDYFLDQTESGTPPHPERTGTLFYGRDLTPAQLDYAVTLAEARLRGIAAVPPTHAQIAARWGVAERAVARAFEDIRERLRREGVRSISRQEQLVEYLVVNRIVTLQQLEAARLDQPDGPRRRADIEAEFKLANLE